MQKSPSSFVKRVIGAIRLDPATSQEVEQDTGVTWRAAVVDRQGRALRQARAASTGHAVAIAVVAFQAKTEVLVVMATVFGISFMAVDSLTRRST